MKKKTDKNIRKIIKKVSNFGLGIIISKCKLGEKKDKSKLSRVYIFW